MSNSLKRKMADGQSEENEGPIETVNDQQQQQQKEFCEKCAKMETELRETKQLCKMKDLENRALQSELEKQNLMAERNALQAKIDMMEKEKKEQQNEQGKYVSVVQMKPILDKINELEEKQNEQSKANADQLSKLEKQNENTTKDQFSKIQNDQKKIWEKINEMGKEQKEKRKVFLNFRQNFWDGTACHKDLKIIGDKNLTAHYKGKDCAWCSVFAKHPILLNNNNSSDIFYYEISVKKRKCFILFGFAVKQQTQLNGTFQYENGTFAYEGDGELWTDGKQKGANAQHSYGNGDTVGIGVNSATRQIIFTKNGLRLDSSADLFVAPSFADFSFYPFVSLWHSDDKIEANFGPNFKFDLATL